MGNFQLRDPDYVADLANDHWKLQPRGKNGEWSKIAGEATKVEGTLSRAAAAEKARARASFSHVKMTSSRTVSGVTSKGESFLQQVKREEETWHTTEHLTSRKEIREFRQKTHEERLGLYEAHGLKLEHHDITDEDLFAHWEKESDPDKKALLELEIKKRAQVLAISARAIASAADDAAHEDMRKAFDRFHDKVAGTPIGLAIGRLRDHLLSDNAFDAFARGKEKVATALSAYGTEWRNRIAEGAAMVALFNPIGKALTMLGNREDAEVYHRLLENPMLHLAIVAGLAFTGERLADRFSEKRRAARRVLRKRKAAARAARLTPKGA